MYFLFIQDKITV